MAKLPKDLEAFKEKYGVDSDEFWCVHGTTWVMKHKALERVAAAQGITFGEPKYLPDSDVKQGFVSVLVKARLGDREDWAFGEASPKNNKNQYPVAMASKRARDRVVLQLLNAHGYLYSEAEADEFAQPRQNPHVNRAADFYEEVSDDIPDAPSAKMKVKDARPQFEALIKEMRRIQDATELREWGEAQASTINSFPGEWPTMFRGEYTKHKQSISNGRAA